MLANGLSRRHFLATSSTLAAVIAAESFPQFTRADEHKSVNVRMQNDIGTLDPNTMSNDAEGNTLASVMPSLAQFDLKGDKIGWRPSSYVSNLGVSDDGLRISFTLKPGFQWTNGNGELSAEDVKYTFERAKKGDWAVTWTALDHVEVADNYSGALVLKFPFEPFWMTTLAPYSGVVISKKATEAVEGKYTTEIPATCGPYVYHWTPKTKIVFTRNPDWKGSASDFDQINYIDIDDTKAAELAYEAGELDITQITPATAVRYKSSPPANSKVRVAGYPKYMWMGMNTQHPKLADIRVRQAIQHAVDVDSILTAAYSGLAKRAYGFATPGEIGRRETTKIDFDPEKSRALLKAAGVTGLELELRTLSLQDRMAAAQIIQANLQDIGITVKIVPEESGAFWDMGQEAKGNQWKDLQLWLMRFGSVPDPYDQSQWFVKDQIGKWNWERWSDPEFEDLFKKGMTEKDPAKRNDIYIRMQEIMDDTGAYVWIANEPIIFVHRDWLAPDITPNGDLELTNFKRV